MTKRVVVIEAEDWAMYSEQLNSTHPFKTMTGLVCGFLVREDRKTISLTQQWFDDERQVRQTITIPKKNILNRTELKLIPKK